MSEKSKFGAMMVVDNRGRIVTRRGRRSRLASNLPDRPILEGGVLRLSRGGNGSGAHDGQTLERQPANVVFEPGRTPVIEIESGGGKRFGGGNSKKSRARWKRKNRNR